MAKRYFVEEVTAVPLKVLARALANTVPALIAYPLAAFFRLRGVIGWPLQPTYGVGELGSEEIVERDTMPTPALARWEPIVEQFADLGFRSIKYSIADVIGEKEQAAAVFLDGPGTTLATLEWIRVRGANGIEEKTPFEFNSYSSIDPEFMTGAINDEDLALADMLKLDFVDTLLLSNAMPVSQVYELHRERFRQGAFYPMTAEAALKEHEERRARRFSWALDKGLMRPLSPSEVEDVRRKHLG